MDRKRIYVDLENTLSVGFVTGIQRVALKTTRSLMAVHGDDWEIVPVRHCEHCSSWILIDPFVGGSNTNNHRQPTRFNGIRTLAKSFTTPWIRSIARKTIERLRHAGIKHAHKRITGPATKDIFLDIDSSWHNRFKRSDLLPRFNELGVKIVVLHYDIIPLLFPEVTHENTVKVFRNHFFAHVEADSLFVCISERSERDLRDYLGRALPDFSPRTTVIRLGDFEPPPDIADKPVSTLVDGRQYLLYVATVEPRKNHAMLLDVFDDLLSDFPELHLVMVGRLGWASESTATRIQSHSEFGGRLIWHESADDALLDQLYKNAFLFVSTSNYEGYGLPTAEALSRDCVSICTSGGALTEHSEEFVDYIDTGDKAALKARIAHYLTDSSAYLERKHQVSGRQKRLWADTADQLINIIKDESACSND